jgi:thioredoxin 1
MPRADAVFGSAEPTGNIPPHDFEEAAPVMPQATITTLTDQTFDEEIRSSTEPVLVDFWAEWCGPCKLIAPILEEIAEEHAGRIRIAKLNVDDSPATARRFEVMAIPTLILFVDGEPAKRLVGAKGKGQLLEELAAYL